MRKAYKIIFLGNSSVGKTTLISQYLYNKIQTAAPTVGIDFLSKSLEVDGETVRLQLWDTAGQERFHSIITNYTRNTFIAVIVYSVDNEYSFMGVKDWIDNFVLAYNERENVRIVIVGNKCDKMTENSFDPEFTRAKELADELGAVFVPATALESEGVVEMADVIKNFISEDLKNPGNDAEPDDELNMLATESRRAFCC